MIVRMGLLQKQAGLTDEEFREYWSKRHSTVASTLPGLRRYHQNHVTEASQRAITFRRGSKEYEGFSQLWFDDLEAMVSAIENQANTLTEDESHFIGDLDLVIAEPAAVIQPPEESGAIKRMSTLRRLPGTSVQHFVDEWRHHADLVRQMPGVLGYVQNVVVARGKDAHGKSAMPDAGYDAVPIDGVVEMWFRDTSAIEDAFSSPQGQKTMSHAKSFLGEINTYLVDCLPIVDARES